MERRITGRRIILDKIAGKLFSFSTIFALIILAVLIYRVLVQSIGWLNLRFLTANLSISPDKAGIRGVLTGTFMLMGVTVPVTLLLGVSTAVYLEEFSKRGRLYTFIRTNISNLAGVPSVIFGLLGLTVFSRLLGLGSSILAGGLTLSLLVLPVIVTACQEAIRAVPGFLREASYALGATKWTTVKRVVLPAALPGIMTGSILSLSRAIGETAPLIVLGIPALILKIPRSFTDDFTALPIQIYYWTLDAVLTPQYINLAAAAIIVLVSLMFAMNFAAILIRNRFQKRY